MAKSGSDNVQTAVIKESLRLSHGVVSPLQRVTGITTAMIAGTAVPPQVRWYSP